MAYDPASRAQRYDVQNATESPELPPLPAPSPLVNSPTTQPFPTNGLPSNPKLDNSESKQEPRHRVLSDQSSIIQFDDRAPSTSQATPRAPQKYALTDAGPTGDGGVATSKKKMNPLSDLIRTEGLYVEDLSVIVKVRLIPPLIRA